MGLAVLPSGFDSLLIADAAFVGSAFLDCLFLAVCRLDHCPEENHRTERK